jgi:transposase
MENPYAMCVGLDMGGQEHELCMVDADGDLVGRHEIGHGGAAIADMLTWLAQRRGAVPPAAVGVAVEAPRGAVIDALLEHGYAVFSINPKQLDRFRDRHSMAGAKDDARDAYVLADSLRTDLVRYRRLQPDHPLVIRLRELSRNEQALQHDWRRAANQLWSYLQRYFPDLLRLCPAADELWLFDLLEACDALPQRATRLRRARLEKLLRSRRIRRFGAEQLYQHLRHPLPLAPGVDVALAEQILFLLPRLRLLHSQLAVMARRIDQLLEQMSQPEEFPEHRSVQILRSIPGLGRVFHATVLSEATTALSERDYHALRALAGVAPVTRQSGKSRIVAMRRACNLRLRNAVINAVNVHRRYDPRAHSTYVSLRAKANSHSRALRGVADRLLELLCLLLHRNQLYDPSRRASIPIPVAS